MGGVPSRTGVLRLSPPDDSELQLDSLGGERTTLAVQAAGAIREAIVDGRLVGGERYSVARLAERFGISRTPVREALLVLERQGMVRFERNKGVRVLPTTAHDLEEIFVLRLLLEVPATRRAATLIDGDGLAALEHELAAMERLAGERDESAFMAHDRAFHEIVLRVAGNQRLVDVVRGLRELVRYRGASTVGRSRDLHVVLQAHVVIYEALRVGDAEGAAAAMRRHVLDTGRLLLAQEGGAEAELAWRSWTSAPDR